jgi:two-component system, OmpR family, response regulator MprA
MVSVQMRVLVVDDDASLREALRRALSLEGYEVALAADGVEALGFFRDERPPPDAVVLDVLMPRLDGWETCRAIRLRSSVPVLMLTARDAVEDKVDGLDAGADDYLVKPFALNELFARLRALLRRTATGDDGSLHFADLDLDPVAREVRRAGSPILLTRTEFALLELFMLHPRKVLPRTALFESVWGYDLGLASNSLEVFVGYLRRKTEAFGGSRLIHTVRLLPASTPGSANG